MNSIYSIIWSKIKEKWIVVSEKAGSSGCPIFLVGALSLAALLLTITPSFAIDSGALPTEGKITSGIGTIVTNGTQMTVTQKSAKMIASWSSFNIGESASVHFQQQDAASIALNRIGDQNASKILGNLSSTGTVFLINPNGIIFGKTAKVDVGSLVASTLNLSDNDFLNGRYPFSDGGNAGNILNKGEIKAGPGGVVALIAPKVKNKGSITADNGSVAMLAGSQVLVDFNGDGLIRYTIDQGTVDALVENKGLIRADGGLVVMSAEAADALSWAVVRNKGEIRAQTLEDRGGRILLLSDMEHGSTVVDGRLDATAPKGGDGGFVETSGANVKIGAAAVVDTRSTLGKTGNWLIDPRDYIIAASGGDASGSDLGNWLIGSNITISTATMGHSGGNGDIFVNDNVQWSGANSLTLNAERNISINSTIGSTSGGGALVLRADLNGTSTGTVTVNSGGSINSSGVVSIYYNPSDYTNPTAYANSGTGTLTAYMLVNDIGPESPVSGSRGLQAVNQNLSGNYALGKDIDATGTSSWNSGAGFMPIGDDVNQFTGIFDGLGHKITGLTINRSDTNYIGLFGYTGGAARICNVGLDGGNFSGGLSNSYIGSLVGENVGGTISNCYSTASVTGNQNDSNVGGLVGSNDFDPDDITIVGTITNSYSTGQVTGRGINISVGGLASYNSGTISHCYSSGQVASSGEYNYIGGLVGYNDFTIDNSHSNAQLDVDGIGDVVGGLVGFNGYTIRDSFSAGSVMVSDNGSKSMVGGLVGLNSNEITNSFSTASVSGSNTADDKQFIGGLVGMNDSGTINTSYSTGPVGWSGGSHVYVGGLAGYNDNGVIESSYSTGSVTGSGYNSYVGGLAGYNDNIDSGHISWSYSTGTVTGIGSGAENCVGGLVGQNYYGTITGSYSASSTIADGNGSVNYVGGLVGNSSGLINYSYSTGSVSCTGDSKYVGGLFGINSGLIEYCYSSGLVNDGVSESNVGGLVGMNAGGTYNTCYWDMESSQQSTSDGGTGLATAEMMQSGSFNGWDFSASTGQWFMVEDCTRPFLRSEWSSTITNAHQLQLMSMDPGANYKLANNIDMGELALPSGMWKVADPTLGIIGGFAPVGDSTTPFTGHFDGQSHTITGLTINSSSDSVGLFGSTGNTATISNIGLYDESITGNVDDSYVGGLVGRNNGSITNSFCTGSVSGTGFGISVGGVAGDNDGAISDSYSNCLVSGVLSSNQSNLGGLVGWNKIGTITNSYSSGSFAYVGLSEAGGAYIGGLVGRQDSGSITNCYWYSDNWDTEKLGPIRGVGIVANDESTEGSLVEPVKLGIMALSHTEMTQSSSFVDWDIANTGGSNAVWRIYDGYSYPLLRSFLTPLTVTADSDAKTYDGQAYIGNYSHAYSISGAVTNGAISYSNDSQGAVDAGTYDIKLSGLYSVDQQGYDISYVAGTLTIRKADYTKISGNKSYDGSTGFSDVMLEGVNGETFKVQTATANSKDVADADHFESTDGMIIGNGVSKTSNYNDLDVTKLTGTDNSAKIGKAEYTKISGNKSYDGSTGFSDVMLEGVNGETFKVQTATANSKDVLTASHFESVGGTISGNDSGSRADNYNQLSLGSLSGNTARITAKVINLDGTKYHDGNVNFIPSNFGVNGLVAGVGAETVQLNGTGTVPSPGIDAGKQALSIGNLTLTAGVNGGLGTNYTLTGGTHYGTINYYFFPNIPPRELDTDAESVMRRRKLESINPKNPAVTAGNYALPSGEEFL
ncbi:MAG: filamentous hemagglutinin N-terminal domain-containing protein [Chlorobiaceae bacterium]|nr:filamentous hemagglutinin N-terminal domain-containing protein [Chlorobiaceae bacterium]